MARRTVKIELPVGSPDEFSKLLNRVLEKHTELGAESPLNNNPKLNMGKYKTDLSDGDKKREESEKLREQAENSMQQARQLYGTDKGQTVDTPLTLYYQVAVIRDFLLSLNKGNEEALSIWGFPVVVNTAKSPSSTDEDPEIEPEA